MNKNNHMQRKLAVFSLLMLALSISLGAFGAHILKEMVDLETQQTFETAVKYQFFCFIILLIISFQAEFTNKKYTPWIRIFITGIVLFSGSLFTLVLGKIGHFNAHFAGPITPLGGLFMIVGLLTIALQVARNKPKQ